MSHSPPVLPATAQPLQGGAAHWFVADDYPAAALRRAAAGRAVARLRIGTDGRVTGCTIVTSSGDADLDHATCAVPVARARFAPALSQSGRPMIGSYTLNVRWALPQDGAPSGTRPPPARALASAAPPRRDWFERLLAAHHLVGFATGLFAVLGSRIRRWLGKARAVESGGWRDADRMPTRRWPGPRLRGRWGRLATAILPAALLAGLLAWLGW